MNINKSQAIQTLIFVIGPSGCGKSTLAQKIARLNLIDFIEGDDFHPQSNIDKMKSGYALSDKDRWPWFELLKSKIKSSNNDFVVSASFLKSDYRECFKKEFQNIIWVVPYFNLPLLKERLKNRQGHFFNPDLLDSQLKDWQAPLDSEAKYLSQWHSDSDLLIDELKLKNSKG